jgi:acylphosphatase
MQRAEKEEQPERVTKTIVFTGPVQMAGFRDRIVKPAKECGLEGLVFNDQDERTVVKAIVNGPRSSVSTFIEEIEGLITKLGVEMKVGDADVPPGSLPLPVARIPNSVYEEVDRFDRALGILQDMSESLREIVHTQKEMLGKQTEMLKNQSSMLENQSSMLKVLEKIESNTEQSLENQSSMMKNQSSMLENQSSMLKVLENIDKNTGSSETSG